MALEVVARKVEEEAALQQRASAKPDSAEAREAVQEVVILAASPEPLVQLGAAALLARLTDHAEGARHALKCGGLGPLMNLWEQQHAATTAGEARIRVGPSDTGHGTVGCRGRQWRQGACAIGLVDRGVLWPL